MTSPIWLDAAGRRARSAPAGPVAARSRRCGSGPSISGRTAGRRRRRYSSRAGAAAPRSTSRSWPPTAGGNSCRSGILSDAESAAPVRARGAALTAIRRLPGSPDVVAPLPTGLTLYSDPLRGPAPGSRGAGSSTWPGPPSRTRPLDDAKRGVLFRQRGAGPARRGAPAGRRRHSRSSPGAAGPRSPPCGAGSSVSATSSG